MKTKKEIPIITPTPPCQHRFVYGGVKFSLSDYPIPGGGAYLRHYQDWFYCEKCLENQYRSLNFTDNSYQSIKFNAIPL
jgi:hypothetical protein